MYEYDIWFSLAKLSPKIKTTIIRQFNSLEEIFQETILNNQSLSNSKVVDVLKRAWDKEKIKKIEFDIYSKNIKIVSFYDELYPKRLTYLEDSPAVLFFKGELKMLDSRKNVSLVGSRECTSYGINLTQLISKELSSRGINIISGLARGIDSYAHRSCIENNGYTCAVLGCGIDVIYPKENRKLYNDIESNGCILSEFIPGTEPFAYNFPQRNRIISGLGDIVIIIEAGTKSGSLVTAGLALDQGKDVMAVPGSVFSELSRGTNKLIKDGAHVLTNIEDVFMLLGLEYEVAKVKNRSALSGVALKIYDTLSNNPIHIDDIIRITKVDIKQIYNVLFELQLKNEILCLAGNYYVKLNSKL